jgi:hypothetical protein
MLTILTAIGTVVAVYLILDNLRYLKISDSPGFSGKISSY